MIIGNNEIYLITLNKNLQQKSLKDMKKLTEKENAKKMELFLSKSEYEVAYLFAKNQNADDELLAELSKKHGDNQYDKQEY